MEALSEQFGRIEGRRKTLEVYTTAERTVRELERQFASKNVAVTRNAYAANDGGEFVVVRGPDGETRAAIGIEQLQATIAPDVHPPWERSETDTDLAVVFDFLDDTLFTSFDRRQMLAASREIEERAWRVGRGVLYVGFQRSSALAAQATVYEQFARDTDVEVTVFVEDEPAGGPDDGIDVVTSARAEIGRFWFVLFDGAGNDQSKCGLLAEERAPGQFYGFWTYEPGRVDEIVAYLQSTYDVR